MATSVKRLDHHNDDRVRWRNYKFVPTPTRAGPRNSCCTRLTFSYMTPVAKDGYLRPPLTFEDVYLAPFWHAEALWEKAQAKYLHSAPAEFFRVFVGLERYYILWAIFFNVLDMIAEAVRPLILKAILREIDGDRDFNMLLLYSFLMFFASCLVGIGHSQYLNTANCKVGLRYSATMSSLIFSKLLKMYPLSATSGNALNLIVGDAKILADTSMWIFRFPGFSAIILYSIGMLFVEIGMAAFVGVSTLVLIMVLQWCVGSRQSWHQKRKQARSDKRLGLISEMISSIRGIKFNGWEEKTEARIGQMRALEVKSLLGFRTLWAVNEFLAAMATVGASVLAIIAYAYLSPTFNISSVFTAIAFFNLLRQPLQFIPLMISSISKGYTSLQRIKTFLEAEEKPAASHQAVKTQAEVEVRWKDAVVGWSVEKDSKASVLHKVSLQTQGPGLFGIIGKVGSGKSTFLSAMLQDAVVYEGDIRVSGSIGYAPQQAWIMNATIRDNILFGSKFVQDKYDRVVRACCLDVDFENLPAEDMTEIGEQGVNLSGGQKQRLALARCAYSDAQIMLFDDPLSALDASVAKKVFDSLFLEVLKDKTVFLVTHYLHLLGDCSRVFVLDGGRLTESGTYEELCARDNALLKEYVATPDEVDLGETLQAKPIAARGKAAGRTTSTSLAAADEAAAGERDAGEHLIVSENRETGMVTRKTWVRYFDAFGGWRYGAWIIVSSVFIEATFSLADWWLTHEKGKMLHVYGVLAIGNALTNVIRVTLFAMGTVRAAKVLHEKILNAVVSAPVLFFDVNPAGRVLQRMAGDFFDVEVVLPHFLEHAWLCMSHVIGIVVTMLILAPFTVIGLLPIFTFYFYLQKVYTANNRETKRLQSLSQSPVASVVSEAISGQQVIRAFNMESKYEVLFFKNFDGFTRSEVLMKHMGYWQHLRVQFCGACIAFTACLVCSLTTSAGVAGLVINFAIIINFYLGGWVYLMSETEAFLTSVERIGEYVDMKQEAARYIPGKCPVQPWPSAGRVEFDQVCLRYRPKLSLALKSASFTVPGGTTCGVVGRTGAGKSTLAVALFRLFEIESGQIRVDGVNMGELGLQACRRAISIVPQNPVLFNSNVRTNLDPFGEYNDSDMWMVLEKTNLIESIQQLILGENQDPKTLRSSVLEAQIAENGENLSVGTRQLFCLARAMLQKPKVMILDEATSALDLGTDRVVQKTLREQFKQCTVIIVAHRLETIASCDSIIVMSQGSVKEQGPPESLIKDTNGAFYKLVEATGKSLAELRASSDNGV